MELDSGAAVTIISEKYSELFSDAPLRQSLLLFKTYSGERLSVVGDMSATVQYEQQTQDLVLTVLEGDGPCLLGRNWLWHLILNWREIKAVSQESVENLSYLLDKYGELFTNKLRTKK